MRPRVRDDVALMAGYHSPQIDVNIRLNTNESPVPPPVGFTDALADELARVPWHRYPDRAATDLRQAIAAHHDVEAAQVFAANGSNEVLQTVLLAYGGPGRTAATFEPTYALHSHIARITATGVASGQRDEDFSLAVAEVDRVIDTAAPDITFLCSPNNPTGIVESDEVIDHVIGRATGLVVVDEAYGQFAPRSALDRVGEDRPVVVTRTYSKTWAMAGARLGYLIGPTWLVAELEKVALPYHLDHFKQIAGRVALRFESEMDARVAALVEERGHVVSALADLPVTVWPSGANFVLFRPESRPGADVWQALVDRSVLVRNCGSWPGLDGCLRMTIGTPSENLAFLDVLTDILEDR